MSEKSQGDEPSVPSPGLENYAYQSSSGSPFVTISGKRGNRPGSDRWVVELAPRDKDLDGWLRGNRLFYDCALALSQHGVFPRFQLGCLLRVCRFLCSVPTPDLAAHRGTSSSRLPLHSLGSRARTPRTLGVQRRHASARRTGLLRPPPGPPGLTRCFVRRCVAFPTSSSSATTTSTASPSRSPRSRSRARGAAAPPARTARFQIFARA